MHALTQFFLDLLRHFGYGGLFVAMTLANIGAPIGSEIILPASGAFAAKGYLSNVWICIVVAVVAELAGQSIGYAVGRFGGRPFIERFGKYVRFHNNDMDRVHGFFTRYGNIAIFLCRFVPVVRGVVGIAAGIAEMPLVPFYLWTLLGSTLFCGGFIYAGYALGAHSEALTASFGKIALGLAALAVLAAVAYALVRRSRKAQTSTP
ncbi:MAG: DedA family protein [Candidatus Baltobacteraceae bacterium]